MHPPRPGLLYLIRDTLYVALTNRTPTTPLIETRGPGFKFARNFIPLGAGTRPAEPEAGEILVAVQQASRLFPDWNRRSIVFAGRGEPLLRSRQLFEVAKSLASMNRAYDLRLNTCGQFSAALGKTIRASGIRAVSIGLNAHDEQSYRRIMQPESDQGFQTVILFMRACSAQGLDVEATCVNRPGIINLALAHSIAHDAGATFRLRDYFP